MSFRRVSVAALMLLATTAIAQAQSSGVSTIRNTGGEGDIDFANARPTVLQQSPRAPISQAASMAATSSSSSEKSFYSPGAAGDSLRLPVKLPKSKYISEGSPYTSQEYGTSNHPFTTAWEKRPELEPYRRAGKLFYKDGKSSYVCSASLIKRGLIITAAHCVAKFGAKRFYKDFTFVPGYSGGDAPFGKWTWDYVAIRTGYYNGTDACASGAKGVICASDIALIALKPQNGRYAGTSTGYYGYGTGGYSYTKNKQVLVTQLGYPVSLNDGEEMMRTDSQGFVDSKLAGNTVIGSAQTGGSSGGPWLVNFGAAPLNDSSNPDGTNPNRNTVIGVTSWGYTNAGVKQQGASFFTKEKLQDLFGSVCPYYPEACK